MAIEPRQPWEGEPGVQSTPGPGERAEPRISPEDSERPEPASPSQPWFSREAAGAPARGEVPLGELAPEPGPGSAIDRQAALRALRSLEATEARLERNARREIEEARGKLIKELLPVLDNLDRTIRAAHTGRSDPAMIEGVRMVRQQLEGVLRGFGVERIESLGQRFDPSIHEAIGMVPVHDPQRHGVVVHEVEPGYRYGGRLLRAAKVNVGKLAAPYDLRPAAMWR